MHSAPLNLIQSKPIQSSTCVGMDQLEDFIFFVINPVLPKKESLFFHFLNLFMLIISINTHITTYQEFHFNGSPMQDLSGMTIVLRVYISQWYYEFFKKLKNAGLNNWDDSRKSNFCNARLVRNTRSYSCVQKLKFWQKIANTLALLTPSFRASERDFSLLNYVRK